MSNSWMPVAILSMANKKAVFFDRDGTLNVDIHYLHRPEDFVWIEGAKEAIKYVNDKDYLAILVTNQSGVARGYYPEEDVKNVYDWMNAELAKIGAHLDALFYCPHHPHKGYAGEVPELKIECSCRKPKPGMLLKAAEDFNIDLGKSWMVGDGENDILAGRNAGCRTALICGAEETGAEETGLDKTGAEESGTDKTPDFGQDMTVRSLSEFAERVLN